MSHFGCRPAQSYLSLFSPSLFYILTPCSIHPHPTLATLGAHISKLVCENVMLTWLFFPGPRKPSKSSPAKKSLQSTEASIACEQTKGSSMKKSLQRTEASIACEPSKSSRGKKPLQSTAASVACEVSKSSRAKKSLQSTVAFITRDLIACIIFVSD